MNYQTTILNWSWWTFKRPVATEKEIISILISTSIIFLVALLLSFCYKPSNPILIKYKKSWTNLLYTCVFLSYMVIFFRWQELPTLSMRIFHGLIVLALVVRSVLLLIGKKVKISKLLSEQTNQDIYQKYLPKKKN